MDGTSQPSVAGVEKDAVVRTAHVAIDAPDPVAALAAALGSGPFALAALFVSPHADFARVMANARQAFPDAQVIGCTTAGEISDSAGYADDSIVAVALPAAHFQVEVMLLPDLDTAPEQSLIEQTIRARARLAHAAPALEREFAFMLVDGLSLREDELASTLASGLGPMPLFGGSAGDGTRFERTFVGHDGLVYSNAAVVALVRTDCPIRVFTLNHFHPTDQRMVVTRADPSRRIVEQINAEPAARELGRILGKDPEQIDTFTFAGNPVVVRFGGTHHVRAIKRVTEDGALEFFSAIDEGLVLTLAEAAPMAAHLEKEFKKLAAVGKPDAILACDCVLRRIEAEQKQATRDLCAVLSANRVAGFSTYGEQINSMHVNQTMTGVAIYPPEPAAGT